tara:strand:- start:2228 stop:2728 length:501 start_codon:yes stop_codon:yes gene_type:complete
MYKNPNYQEGYQLEGGGGLQNANKCPDGFYAMDGGKYCQKLGTGPSKSTAGRLGISHCQDCDSDYQSLPFVDAKVLHHHFSGNIIQLVDIIIELNIKYLRTTPSRIFVTEEVRRFYENIRGGINAEWSCRECLGKNQPGTCISGICLTEFHRGGNKFIKCVLKLRY